MAYERYGRDDGQGSNSAWDRENDGVSRTRDYRAAGDLGGYGRDNQREYGQRDYGQRDDGRRDDGGRGYGARDQGQFGYGQSGYGQRDENNQRFGQGERQGVGGGQTGWGDRDRQGFAGSSDYYRGDADRQSYGRDTYRQSRGTFGRQPQDHGRDAGDRGFFDRAGDEVRSWFGDEEAERRRERDARDDERGGRDAYGRDEHYHSWRKQQIAAFDRDYDEYRQENRSKFHNEFSSFRNERQSQRELLNKVEEHQDVVGSDGEHVGTVDKVRGDRIILTKSDADAGGRHHSIPSRWLQSAENGKLTLRKTAEEAKQHWRDEERQGALFGEGQDRSTDGDEGARTNLNRSFSGTY